MVERKQKMKKKKPAPVKLVAAVERALNILGTFRTDAATHTLAEIADYTGLQKSTALRLLATLERHGYIIRLSDGSYQLGVMLAHLGAIHRASFRYEDHVLPILDQLSQETGESATFYIRQGDQRLCLLRAHSRHLLRDVVNAGDLLPMNQTSSSQVFNDFADATWASVRVDPAKLIRKSARVNDTMTASIAGPVFDGAGLIGVITISGPIGRFDIAAKENSALLVKAITKLNDQLAGTWRSIRPKSSKAKVP